MTKGVIDRFEGEYAIVEIEGETKIINISCIPPEAREGDVLVLEGNVWRVDHNATISLKKQIEARMDRLWKD